MKLPRFALAMVFELPLKPAEAMRGVWQWSGGKSFEFKPGGKLESVGRPAGRWQWVAEERGQFVLFLDAEKAYAAARLATSEDGILRVKVMDPSKPEAPTQREFDCRRRK